MKICGFTHQQKKNINTLRTFGNHVISVTSGELASGLIGEGRMAEPEEIVAYIDENIFRTKELSGKIVLVSAGPTYEAIDPVRFIGNYSSGRMGYAIAEEFYRRGAEVCLVTGPATIKIKYKGIKLIRVTSAKQMYDACLSCFSACDISVMAAAVADYSPTIVADHKIKKNSGVLSIDLTKTADILKTLGEKKAVHQLVAGFALETENEKENALAKLKSKNADLIVLNSLRDEEAGFGKESNKVTIFDNEGNEFAFPAKSKQLVAIDIVELIIKKLHEKI